MDFNEACLNYPIIILIIDPKTGKIVKANKKASQTYGYTIDELCSMKIQQINILNNEQVKKEMQIAKNENRNYFHFPHKSKDGSIIEMEVESFPTLINGKNYLFSTINPCSSRNYFNNIADKYFEESSDPIIVLDQSLRIINFNKSFIQKFKYRKKIISKTIYDVLQTDEVNKLEKIEEKIVKGELANISISFNNFKDEFSFFNILAIPTFFRDSFFGAVITFKNNSLEVLKQKQIANNYKEALKRAEIYREEKEFFFTRMSHNMKTPLTAILSYSEFGLSEIKEEEKTNYFNQINQSASYLLGLIDDLLKINKVEKNKIQLNERPISKTILIERILGIIKPQTIEKNINLITKFDKNIWPYHKFDIFRLEQIYLNILQNAVDFSSPNSTITWTKQYIKDENNKPYFYNEISDNGIGIKQNFIPIMFEPYTTEDNNSKRNGLGLSFAKNLIKQHGGSIWCESEKDIGTTIYFKIPANEISEKEYNDYNKKCILKKSLSNKSILICDDNPINVKIIEKIIKTYSMSCDKVYNGKEAVDKIKANNYFAIIMDIQMPILDGYSATKQIRSFNNETPIIALSTNFLEKDIKKAKDIGMNDYISKPIDNDKLINTLYSFLNKKEIK